MPRSRSFRSTRAGSTARRRVSWSLGPTGILSPASSVVSLFAGGGQATLDDLTIVRTRGELLLSLLTAAAPQQGFQWAFGMCIVSENAFNAGVASVPAPLADGSWDGWFVHHQGSLKSGTATPAQEASDGTVNRLIIDSKAMRKLHQSDFVVGVLETVEAGTATMHAELHTRILSKLP